ncbi:MAG: mechanosensitive ion channel family protein [Candidatus Woesearchaeota archaeon]
MSIKEVVIILTFVLSALILAKLITSYIKIKQKNTSSQILKRILEAINEPIYLYSLYIAITLSSFFYQTKIIFQQHVLYILFLAATTIIFARILRIIANTLIVKQNHLTKAPHLIRGLIYIIVYAISILILLNYFDIEITPFIATLGIGGLAVGLALQGTLSNFFAGLNIMSDGSVNVGDYVELENINGWIEDIGTIYTKIRTIQNSLIVISNTKFASSIIINDSLPHSETNFLVPCGVAYGSDLQKVENVTLEVAKKIQKTIPGAVKDFEPLVRFNEFADSNINFNTILRIERLVDKFKVRHEFIKELKKRFDKEGIEISWPVRKIVNEK